MPKTKHVYSKGDLVWCQIENAPCEILDLTTHPGYGSELGEDGELHPSPDQITYTVQIEGQPWSVSRGETVICDRPPEMTEAEQKEHEEVLARASRTAPMGIERSS